VASIQFGGTPARIVASHRNERADASVASFDSLEILLMRTTIECTVMDVRPLDDQCRIGIATGRIGAPVAPRKRKPAPKNTNS
jgi:hypothetical protein